MTDLQRADSRMREYEWHRLYAARIEAARACLEEYDDDAAARTKDRCGRFVAWDGHEDVLYVPVTFAAGDEVDAPDGVGHVTAGFCVRFRAGTAEVADHWWGG